MKRAINKLYRDERGVVVVMIGALLALLLVFAVYAIDASQMMLVRTQLQNAADAGALAGAVKGALTGDSAQAQGEAILAAGANRALRDSGGGNVMDPVVITDADVTFPQARRIEVTTHRTEATGDPFMNYVLRIFSQGATAGQMTARAAADYLWVCGGKCLEPWAPPDRWADANGNGKYDAGEYYDPVATGYTDADLGTEITFILGNGDSAGFGEFDYYSVDFPPVNKGNPISGAKRYEDWMCLPCLDNSFVVEPGDYLRVEPGKQKGPNAKGLKCIMDSDPGAQWDAASGTVINSAYPKSPRIVKCALFDPSIGLQSYGGGKEVTIRKIMVVFIESVQTSGKNNGQIVGRFMRLNEPDGAVCANQADPSFLFKTRLTE
ncbi:MAG: hypothetical protein HY304_09095 [candidate division Zixibacteria bacterium]|nr:hypothetical protein [candidate division Zixibacteria bacterium]